MKLIKVLIQGHILHVFSFISLIKDDEGIVVTSPISEKDKLKSLNIEYVENENTIIWDIPEDATFTI